MPNSYFKSWKRSSFSQGEFTLAKPGGYNQGRPNPMLVASLPSALTTGAEAQASVAIVRQAVGRPSVLSARSKSICAWQRGQLLQSP